MTVPKQQILGWEDYPEPRVVTVMGTLVVEVSIPRAIRHLFGNGNGKTNNRRLSTGTTDPTVARRKMWPLAHTIYKQFDQMQADAANTHDHQTDNFALDTISALATSFNYNRGVPPELSNKTPYAELKRLKDTLDSYTGMMIDQGPSPEEARAALAIGAHAIRERTDPAQAKAKILDTLANSGPFTMKQNALLAKNATSVVQTYWQDLLTTAAREQGVSVPTFDDNRTIDVTEHEGAYLPEGVIETPTVIERKRRVKSNDTIRISDIRDEYFAFLEQKYEKANTRRKWSRALGV